MSPHASPHAPQQPDVDELLRLHAPALTALRASLGAALPATWDELWLLRYCLSFDDADKRADAARKCIAWRQENAAMLADAAAGLPGPLHSVISPFCVAGAPGASCPSRTSRVSQDTTATTAWAESLSMSCAQDSAARSR